MPSRRSALRRLCFASSAACAAAASTLALGAMLAPPVLAAPAAGVAEVVHAQDGTTAVGQPIASGSATDKFTLRLPAGASCSGDSAHGEYRVQSFMVPDGVDTASLTFGPNGPTPRSVGGNFRQPLYAPNTTPFVNAATNLAEVPGGPGTIINIPSFDLHVFKAGAIPDGSYVIGIACTKGPPSPTQVDRLWSTKLVIGAFAGAPGPGSWTAPESAAKLASGGSPSTTALSNPSSPVATQPSATSPSVAATASTATTAGAEPAAAAAAATTTGGADDDAVRGDTPGLGGGTMSFRYGAPPTFSLPAAELRQRLAVSGNVGLSILVWLALAIAFARGALLLARPIPTAAVLAS